MPASRRSSCGMGPSCRSCRDYRCHDGSFVNAILRLRRIPRCDIILITDTGTYPRGVPPCSFPFCAIRLSASTALQLITRPDSSPGNIGLPYCRPLCSWSGRFFLALTLEVELQAFGPHHHLPPNHGCLDHRGLFALCPVPEHMRHLWLNPRTPYRLLLDSLA